MKRLTAALVALLFCALPFDTAIARWADALPYSVALNDFTDLGKAWIFFVLAFVFYYVERFRSDAKFALLSMSVAGVLGMFVKALVGRARPDKIHAYASGVFEPFSFDHLYQSFPSGHTQAVFSFAFVIAFRFPKYRWPVLLFAAAIALSRVLLTYHFVSDVIGGVLIALWGYSMTEWIESVSRAGFENAAPRFYNSQV